MTEVINKAARCDSCTELVVNGVRCHETGCPKAGAGSARECKWCGSRFKVRRAGQRFCGRSCERSYRS